MLLKVKMMEREMTTQMIMTTRMMMETGDNGKCIEYSWGKTTLTFSAHTTKARQ